MDIKNNLMNKLNKRFHINPWNVNWDNDCSLAEGGVLIHIFDNYTHFKTFPCKKKEWNGGIATPWPNWYNQGALCASLIFSGNRILDENIPIYSDETNNYQRDMIIPKIGYILKPEITQLFSGWWHDGWGLYPTSNDKTKGNWVGLHKPVIFTSEKYEWKSGKGGRPKGCDIVYSNIPNKDFNNYSYFFKFYGQMDINYPPLANQRWDPTDIGTHLKYLTNLQQKGYRTNWGKLWYNEITIDIKHYGDNLPNIIEAIVIDRYIKDPDVEKKSVDFYNEYVEYYKLNKHDFPLLYFDKKNWDTPFYNY